MMGEVEDQEKKSMNEDMDEDEFEIGSCGEENKKVTGEEGRN